MKQTKVFICSVTSMVASVLLCLYNQFLSFAASFLRCMVQSTMMVTTTTKSNNTMMMTITTS